jgi:hypothetical protein
LKKSGRYNILNKVAEMDVGKVDRIVGAGMNVELQDLREELYRAISSNAATSQIVVDLSVQLDKMILEFYKQAAETY